jgi:hypothetical protein
VIAKLGDEGLMSDEFEADVEDDDGAYGASDATKTSKLSSDHLFALEKMKLEMNEKRAIREFDFREQEINFKEQELKMRERQSERELEMRRLEIQRSIDLSEARPRERYQQSPLDADPRLVSFNVYNAQKSVPKFDETDLDKYLNNFEKVAVMMKWPREYWTLVLQSQLCGKAAEAYSCLTIGQSKDYDVVKSTILNAYALLPEAYRQKFRNLRKENKESYADYA